MNTICIDCAATLPRERARGYLTCEPCSEKRRQQWRDEHTRIAPDGTRRQGKGWMIGDHGRVTIAGEELPCEILDMRGNTSERDHELMQLKLARTVRGLDGNPFTSVWTHPQPVPSYRLRRLKEGQP